MQSCALEHAVMTSTADVFPCPPQAAKVVKAKKAERFITATTLPSFRMPIEFIRCESRKNEPHRNRAKPLACSGAGCAKSDISIWRGPSTNGITPSLARRADDVDARQLL